MFDILKRNVFCDGYTSSHNPLGLGIMLAANEVPRIAQQFGLDSSVRVNMMSVVHATTTAVNLTRSVARAAGR